MQEVWGKAPLPLIPSRQGRGEIKCFQSPGERENSSVSSHHMRGELIPGALFPPPPWRGRSEVGGSLKTLSLLKVEMYFKVLPLLNKIVLE